MKLHTDNIKKSYKGRPVVKGVSVEVNQGEIVERGKHQELLQNEEGFYTKLLKLQIENH